MRRVPYARIWKIAVSHGRALVLHRCHTLVPCPRGARARTSRVPCARIWKEAAGGDRRAVVYEQPDSMAAPQGRRLGASDTAQGGVRTGDHSLASARDAIHGPA
jgi:hypothetical protein